MTLTTPLFAIPSGPELVIVLLIAVLLFGANKIPKLARSTGQAMGEFRRGREEVEEEIQEIRDTTEEDLSEATPDELSDSDTSVETGTDSTTDSGTGTGSGSGSGSS
jgi:sec-independent protein translocase protein TatA